MQLLPLFLIMVLLAVDQGFKSPVASWHLPEWVVIALACAPVFIIIGVLMLIVWRCERQMARGRGPGPIILADRAARIARILVIVNHAAAVLIFGWLGVIRDVTGNLVLVDELIALLPALLGLIGTWWAAYPIERRLHEALLIRRLDEGQPVHPVLSRTGYAMLQVRLHLLLMLVPLLLILGAREVIDVFSSPHDQSSSTVRVHDLVALLLAAGIFVVSPLLARFMLDVEPLTNGPLRETLMAVCDRHRVKMRELLIWNTNGSMINAAVMGLIGPLRYVLITDALVELLRLDQVRAVMAHEIGHVRRRHLPWLVGCLMACFALAWVPVALLWNIAVMSGWIRESLAAAVGVGGSLEYFISAAPLVIALLLFGWISRRFERQADTFAVQHLSGLGRAAGEELQDGAKPQALTGTNGEVENSTAVATASPPPPVTIPTPPVTDRTRRVTTEAVNAMRGALQSIAMLNTVDPHRRSWRHGSIAWRQKYLASIVGKPILGLPIDRTIRRIKLATAVVLVAAIALTIFESRNESRIDSDRKSTPIAVRAMLSFP